MTNINPLPYPTCRLSRCEQLTNSLVSIVSIPLTIYNYLSWRSSQDMREPAATIHLSNSPVRPGCSFTPVKMLKLEERHGAFDLKTAEAGLQKFKDAQLKLDSDLWMVSGFLEADVPFVGHYLKNKLGPYISNIDRVRVKTFFGAAFRKSTLDECAESLIDDIDAIYKNTLADVIHINIAAHSMGARITDITIQKLADGLPCGKQLIIDNLFSLAGANRGSPWAELSIAACCCKKYIGKELRRTAIEAADRGFRDVDIVKRASYLVNKGDRIIRKKDAMPSGRPIIVINYTRLDSHTAILNHALTKWYILRSIQVQQEFGFGRRAENKYHYIFQNTVD